LTNAFLYRIFTIYERGKNVAVNKKEEFPKNENEIASFAKALSHPARVSILKTLAEKNSCICGEIVEVLPLSQSTVSQHLKELKNSGIIQGEIDGPSSCYCINWVNLDKEIEIFNNFINYLKEKYNSIICCSEEEK
jgi:ArsR family transcriptional regulator